MQKVTYTYEPPAVEAHDLGNGVLEAYLRRNVEERVEEHEDGSAQTMWEAEEARVVLDGVAADDVAGMADQLWERVEEGERTDGQRIEAVEQDQLETAGKVDYIAMMTGVDLWADEGEEE